MPDARAFFLGSFAFRGVLVSLGRIALVIVHLGDYVIFELAAKDFARLDADATIHRALQ